MLRGGGRPAPPLCPPLGTERKRYKYKNVGKKTSSDKEKRDSGTFTLKIIRTVMAILGLKSEIESEIEVLYVRDSLYRFI